MRIIPFPAGRVNSEFVQVLIGTHIRMRVWERGSGETWACGTGQRQRVCLRFNGPHGGYGKAYRRGLLIRWTGKGHLFMTGPAVEVFTGNIDIPENLYYDYE